MIIPGLTDTYKAECLWGGIHLPAHEYRLALYNDSLEGVVLGPQTKEYTRNNEARGQGYEPGGKVLDGRQVQVLEGIVCMDWRSPVWQVATLREIKGALIYNASLPGRNSVCVVDFDEPITAINGPFVARLPEPGPNTSLIQWVD